jgi:hypothetical protein
MAFTIIDATGPIVSARISGELSRSEVGQLQTAALAAIGRWGKISALFILEEFSGWQSDSGWGDLSFLTAHDHEIAKIAVVGGEQWRDFVYAFLAKGFRQAAVEYFLPGELAKARAWLEAGGQ